MEDAGDKASEEEKTAIEAAAADLEEALKGDDKEAIEEKIKVLSEASAEVAQKMWSQNRRKPPARPVTARQTAMLWMPSSRRSKRTKSKSSNALVQ